MTALAVAAYVFSSGGCGNDKTDRPYGPLNAPPDLQVAPILGTVTGDIPVAITVRDAESDPIRLTVHYSIDGGNRWQPAALKNPIPATLTVTNGSEVRDIATNPLGRELGIFWNSGGDLPSQSHTEVRIKVAYFQDQGAETWSLETEIGPFGLNNLGTFSDSAIQVSAESLTLTAGTGQADQPTATLVLFNAGGGSGTWTLRNDSPFNVTLNPSSGSLAPGAAGSVEVRVDTRGLPEGTHTGNLVLEQSGNPERRVPIRVVVEQPTPRLVASPGSLVFEADEAGPNPPAQSVTLYSTGTADVPSWYVTNDNLPGWLSVPSSNQPAIPMGQQAIFDVSVSKDFLGPGEYFATLEVRQAQGTGVLLLTIPVTFRVTISGGGGDGPVINLSPAALTFNATEGSGQSTPQAVTLSNTGGGLMNWSGSADRSWLGLDRASGVLNGGQTAVLQVHVNPSLAGLTPGTYTGTVTITSPDATNGPQSVQVTCNVVSSTPILNVSPTGLTFSVTQGGPNPPQQQFQVSNNGSGTLTYSATWTQSWITANSVQAPGPLTGTAPQFVALSIDAAGLAVGSHTDTILVSAPGAANSPQTVGVTLQVNPAPLRPAIGLSPTALAFNATEGGANPPSQTVQITNTGTGLLNWTVKSDQTTWLSASPGSGSTTTATQTVTVDVNSSGMVAGAYVGTLTITDPNASNDPRTVTVQLDIGSPSGPMISVSPSALAFSATQGGPNPTAQSVNVTNSGTGTLNWTATTDKSWLQVSPSSDSNTGETDTVAVSVSTKQAEAWLGSINSTGAPTGRDKHVSVWTGSEMIVWGGDSNDGTQPWTVRTLNTGGRYDPASDSWKPTSTIGVEWDGRRWASAVWTGGEMVVWGGNQRSNTISDRGERYNPVTDTWAIDNPPDSYGGIKVSGAPVAREGHSAVWTGKEMIVWGGLQSGGATNSGKAYDPIGNRWLWETSTVSAPSSRGFPSAVWTSKEMIVWGGSGVPGTGGRYNPTTDTWGTAPTTVGAPDGRNPRSVIWTGRNLSTTLRHERSCD